MFDEKADATRDINRARERAKRDGRQVLVLWGENKCEFCIQLDGLLASDERIKRLVATEYERVSVDLGHYERNVDLARDVYGTNVLLSGLPGLTIINAATNQPVAVLAGKNAQTKSGSAMRSFDAGIIAAFLEKNKPAPRPATPLLMEMQQKAKRDAKRVLAYLGGYGCERCTDWDRATCVPTTAAILDKAFVLRKFDADRNPLAADLFQRLHGGSAVSPSWMTVIDGDGKPVTEASGGREFGGLPDAGATADWLVAASGGKLTGEDREALTKAFSAALSPSAEPATANNPSK